METVSPRYPQGGAAYREAPRVAAGGPFFMPRKGVIRWPGQPQIDPPIRTQGGTAHHRSGKKSRFEPPLHGKRAPDGVHDATPVDSRAGHGRGKKVRCGGFQAERRRFAGRCALGWMGRKAAPGLVRRAMSRRSITRLSLTKGQPGLKAPSPQIDNEYDLKRQQASLRCG